MGVWDPEKGDWVEELFRVDYQTTSSQELGTEVTEDRDFRDRLP